MAFLSLSVYVDTPGERKRDRKGDDRRQNEELQNKGMFEMPEKNNIEPSCVCLCSPDGSGYPSVRLCKSHKAIRQLGGPFKTMILQVCYRCISLNRSSHAL